jgi:hypothetical protein
VRLLRGKDVNFHTRWWQADAERVHEAVWAMARDMEPDQSARRTENRTLRQLYGAKGSGASAHGDGTLSLGPTWSPRGNWTYNVIRTAVDVLGAKVGRGKPKASFVTTGGTWAEQRRAKRLDRYVYGCMHADDFYRTARRVFRDAAVMDVGAVMGWVEDGRVRLKRVDPDEIKVDVADGYYGEPRTLVRSYVVARDVAHGWVDSWHADKSEDERKEMHRAVEESARGMDHNRAAHLLQSFGDVVQVHEAWHLPTCKPDAKGNHNGRHVLALSRVALVDEPATFFPFAFCRIYEPMSGWYGQGVGEVLAPHQKGINLAIRRIGDIVTNGATMKIWLDSGSKKVSEQLSSNESNIVIKGGARPPVVLAPGVVPPDLWQLVEWPIRRGLEQVGINETAAAASKPAGLNSGQAQRDYQDIQSERQAPVHLAFEDFVLDAARLVVRLSAKAAEDGTSLKAFFPRGRRSEPISWDEVAADEESFTLQVHSTSNLPTTPTARKQYVEELWASGQVDSAEYRRLLDMPDTDASTDLALAARDIIDATLERMLDGDDGEGAEDAYAPPEPYDDLAYAMKRGLIVYAKARADGAPEERLELVRRYLLAAEELMRQAQAAAGPGDMRAPDAAMPTAQAVPPQ